MEKLYVLSVLSKNAKKEKVLCAYKGHKEACKDMYILSEEYPAFIFVLSVIDVLEEEIK